MYYFKCLFQISHAVHSFVAKVFFIKAFRGKKEFTMSDTSSGKGATVGYLPADRRELAARQTPLPEVALRANHTGNKFHTVEENCEGSNLWAFEDPKAPLRILNGLRTPSTYMPMNYKTPLSPFMNSRVTNPYYILFQGLQITEKKIDPFLFFFIQQKGLSSHLEMQRNEGVGMMINEV